MACKWCEDQEDRYTVKYKPSTNLKHHMLKSCAGFHKIDHWADPDVVRALSEPASKVLLFEITGSHLGSHLGLLTVTCASQTFTEAVEGV
jgi:hypothetical protein